jgi:hypothetical protein
MFVTHRQSSPDCVSVHDDVRLTKALREPAVQPTGELARVPAAGS